jgi:choline-sulfatase
MNRREFIGTLGASAGVAAAAQTGSRRPNIVFICLDNFNPNMIGYAGHPIVKTPHIDRLAKQGAWFQNCYCGSPVCAPARASLISGMFPSDVESYCNATPFSGKHVTWAHPLRDAGYYCRASGKMDLTAKVDLGFEQIAARHEHEQSPDITALFRRPLCYRSIWDSVDGSVTRGEHSDEKVLKNSVQFLREDAPKRQQPWCLYVGFVGPLPGNRVEQRFANMYAPEKIDLPRIPPGHLEKLPETWQCHRAYKRIEVPLPEDRIRRAKAAYYGNITAVDERVGKVVEEVERAGIRERTVIVVTSDHGRAMGEHGIWLHDEQSDNSARTPLLMVGPGISAGRRVETPVIHVDLFPTFVELGAARMPSGLRGHSLLPLCQGKQGDHPGIAYSESHSEGNITGSATIRRGKWKYIHYSYYDSLLFDIEKDPGEFENLINTAEGKRVSTELHKVLLTFVDPDKLTEQAFAAQERILRDMCARMTLDQLLESGFESRLGRGQAITLLKKYKG